METNFKSGFVAIVGRPNVGKSTLLNHILNQKVSIISPKPQTTRNQVRGIYTTDTEQIIFIDTPGIHKPKHQLGEFMNKESLSTFRDVELILWIVDATEDFGGGDEYLIKQFKDIETPIFLVVNKIDIVKNKQKLMENIIKYTESFEFTEVYYISALKGENTDKLLDAIKNYLEDGPMYYPADQVSDYPEQFIISELIREKVLYLTREEVPHSIAVVVDQMMQDEENPNLMNIHATIYVERQSQKKIIIGNRGEMIKNIGSLARKEIVMLLGQKIFLELWVKIEPDWRNKINQLRRMGYNLVK
ncbi:MAG TPA: GTPase Era [Acholeplasmataceae bacterium]|jgi:GTP-binding protein Era|nr:GTPase Era [Acholeplasmataceae bacterium]